VVFSGERCNLPHKFLPAAGEVNRMDPLRLGVDVGSTTAKVVVLDAGVTRFADYRRHNAAAQNALCRALEGARAELDNVPV
jgi:activator of 2-hydroxyglutaryl-CoA dehydratase